MLVIASYSNDSPCVHSWAMLVARCALANAHVKRVRWLYRDCGRFCQSDGFFRTKGEPSQTIMIHQVRVELLTTCNRVAMITFSPVICSQPSTPPRIFHHKAADPRFRTAPSRSRQISCWSVAFAASSQGRGSDQKWWSFELVNSAPS